MARVARALAIAAALAGCKSRSTAEDGREVRVPRDAAPVDAITDATRAVLDAPVDGAWSPLATLPRTEPVRVMALPARPDLPRFDVGGPVVVGDIAVVSSSQLGFAGIDWRRGMIVWTKPAGLHVAPPIAKDETAILIGACLQPPEVRDTLLGCLRVVTAAGTDQTYMAIHGSRVDAFAATPGPQAVWLDGDRAVRWRRGDQAVSVDLITGVARPASAAPPPVRVSHHKRTWDITQVEGRIVAHERGKLAWQTRRAYTALVGAVYLAELTPMVRVLQIGPFGGVAELNLLDIDATGSLHGQAAFPVPAISTLGFAIDDVGNTAIAVRMDSSIQHDFIVGYAANAMMMYVYPLPELPRADPVGVAVTPDAVLAFHDGDTFTVLPAMLPPPTAPGTAKPSSKNPTP